MGNNINLFTNDIATAIAECSPEFIAVAYVGKDWSNFINASKLKKIIVSPTLGSNPYAIENIANLISWDKILFLDKLHAKIYIGKKHLVVGSSNLSKNGLTADGLNEAVIKSDSKSLREESIKYFYELEKLAQSQYPTIEKKKEKLSTLKDQWSKAVRHSIISNNNELPTKTIMDYETLSNKDFYIVWYQNDDDFTYSNDVKYIESLIENEMHFADKDKIETNKWILSWQLTNSEKPDKRVNPKWIYIDEIYTKAVESEEQYDYTTLAIERNDRNSQNEPFKLTKESIQAFRALICNTKYKSYFVDGDPFLVMKSFHVFESFIDDWKNETTKISQTTE